MPDMQGEEQLAQFMYKGSRRAQETLKEGKSVKANTVQA